MSATNTKDDVPLINHQFTINQEQLPRYPLMGRLTRSEQLTIKSFVVFKRPNNHLSAFYITRDDGVYGIGENGYEMNILAMEGHYYRCDKVDRPVKVEGLSGKQIKTIILGVMVGAALDSEGRLYWWGQDVEYKKQIRFPELAISNDDFLFEDVSCGHSMIAALGKNRTQTEKKVYIWGCMSEKTCYRWMAELRVKCPKSSALFPIISMSCGYSHVAMVTENGDVYTWGCGDRGQRGYSTYTDLDDNVFKKMELDRPCLSVTCGTHSTFCLTASGELYACGANSGIWSYLGVENKEHYVHKPERVVLGRKVISMLAIRENSTYSVYVAVTADGLYLWSGEELGVPRRVDCNVASLCLNMPFPQGVMLHVEKSDDTTCQSLSGVVQEKLAIIRNLLGDIQDDIVTLEQKAKRDSAATENIQTLNT